MQRVFSILIVATTVFVLFFSTQPVNAACSNTSGFGAAQYFIPDIPANENRALWIRMQIPYGEAKITVEINGDQCIELGGFEQNINEWSWQTNRQDSRVMPITFPSRSDNTIKIIGTHDGVKIDRILLTNPDCIPQDYGNNCAQSTAVNESLIDLITLPEPAETQSGKVTLSSTPNDKASELAKLSYSVNNEVIQEFTTPQPFDTTLLKNGEHTIYITSELKDGRKIKEMIAIKTDNKENAFSSIIRWARLNTQAVKIIISTIVILLVLIIGLLITRSYYKKHKTRALKGLDI